MRKTFVYMTLMMILLMNALCISSAFAQTGEPAAKTGGTMENIAEVIFGSGLVKLFKDGGFAMWPILFVTIYGVAYIIWKFITLLYGKVKLSSLLDQILPLVKQKKYKEATEICKNTRGPVAAIIYAGLLKASEGLTSVEKAVESAAMIEMSYLEKGFTEIATTITLAPMLGFFGTVVGMIEAFDAIAAARAVDATIVASGIKVALITTASGLLVAIPVQFFNNIYVTWVDGLVIDMQRASEKVIEAMVETT